MMVRNISCLIIFGCICAIVLGDHLENKPSPDAKAGPYTSILTRMDKCKKPDLPYQTKKERSGEAVLYLHNDGEEKESGPAIKGNYTSFKEDPDLKLNITDYQEVKGKWEQIFSISGINCHNRKVIRLARIFHINYNKQTCTVPVGTYNFDVDYNQVDHEFQSSRVYGKLLRRVVLTSKRKTVLCLEFESEVAPED